MRQARRVTGRAAARRLGGIVACAVAVAVLAACSGGSQHRPSAQRAGGLAAGRPGLVVLGQGSGGVVFESYGGGSGSGGRPQISVGPIPPASSPQPIVMPLEGYEQIASQQQVILSEASSLATQRCMQARGFVYTVPAQTNDSLASIQQIETGPVGLTSMSQAQTYGYGAAKTASGQAGGGFAGSSGFVSGAAFGSAARQHGQAWTSALERPGAGSHQGCLLQAQSQLYGSGAGDPVPGLAFQALQWARTDPRIIAINRAWARCMSGRGYSYASPLAAAGHRWPKPPSRGEIATATADVSCKTRTNLVHTWLAVEAAYQQAAVAANLTQLAALQPAFGSVLRRAEALITGTGAPVVTPRRGSVVFYSYGSAGGN